MSSRHIIIIKSVCFVNELHIHYKTWTTNLNDLYWYYTTNHFLGILGNSDNALLIILEYKRLIRDIVYILYSQEPSLHFVQLKTSHELQFLNCLRSFLGEQVICLVLYKSCFSNSGCKVLSYWRKVVNNVGHFLSDH